MPRPSAAVASARHERRHRVGERPVGPRVDPDLGRQLGRAREPAEGQLGERRGAPRSGGIAAVTSAPDEVAQRRQAGHGRESRPARRSPRGTLRYAVGVNIAQSLENLKLEQDAIVLYDRLATIEKDPRRAAAFRHIADQRAPSRGHLGDPPARHGRHRARRRPAARPGAADHPDRARVRDAGGRRTSSRRSRATRRRCTTPRATARTSRRSPPTSASTPRSGSGSTARRNGERPGARASGTPPRSAVVTASDHPRSTPAGAGPGGDRRRRALAPERPVRDAAGGHLRRLGRPRVEPVAGDGRRGRLGPDGTSSCSPGIAGLLAGAFSMAAGEYISMQSQRELFERQIELERAELEAMPDEEQRELAALYMAKGFPRAEAERDRRADVRGPGDRARHARPRGARPRPGRARLAVGRGVRLVPRVRRSAP